MIKKIVLSVLVLCTFSAVFAYAYDENFKKGYYEGFISSMFSSLQSSLLSQGFSRPSVNMYIYKMKSRLDRTKLENDTWECVSKYSYSQLLEPNTVYGDCFERWTNKFFLEDNNDLRVILKK